MRPSPIIAVLLVSSWLVGCAGAPVARHFAPVGETVDRQPSRQGEGKIVFLNESWALMGTFPATNGAMLVRSINKDFGAGKIDITIDGKGLGRVDVGEYVQVNLPYGRYTVVATNKDLVDTWTTEELVVSQPWTLVRVHPGSFGGVTWQIHERYPPEHLRQWREAK